MTTQYNNQQGNQTVNAGLDEENSRCVRTPTVSFDEGDSEIILVG